MQNVLPDLLGMEIDGVAYKYTITKDPDTDATVYIRNQHVNGGLIYNHEDNWDQLPGNTRVGFDPLAPTLADLWGDGEIGVEGDGQLSDVTVTYSYKYNICVEPLSDPSCPGYADAWFQQLLDNALFPEVDDPYYNEYVQAQLELEAEVVEEEQQPEEEAEEEKEELDIEKALAVSGAAEKIADAVAQQSMLVELANVEKLNSYYDVNISGGAYNETLELKDSTLPDNNAVLRNLATDTKHTAMIRSQYNN